MCLGCTDDEHSNHAYLSKFEGSFLCGVCDKKYCKHCMFSFNQKEPTENICTTCKRVDRVEDTSISNTEQQMRLSLRKCGIDMKSGYTCLEVKQTHTKVEDMEMLHIFEKEIKDVMYPLENPSIFLRDASSLNIVQNKMSMIEFTQIMDS